MAKDSTTPSAQDAQDEMGRLRFLAQATVALGSVVGLGLIIPLAATLWPKSELLSANKGWSPLAKDEFDKLKASLDKPIKIHFQKKGVVDGYLVSDQDYYVWGVHMTPDEEKTFQAKRPDLFDPKLRGDVTFPVGVMGFAMLSSVCPHLGCKPDWDDGLKGFLCPCHGSQFDKYGAQRRNPDGSPIGPALRGLDPVPFREQSGIAEVEWVKYFANVPYRLIVSYS